MIPSAYARAWLSKTARQYAYAFWMAVLFTVVTIKVFWLTDAGLAASLNGPYGALALSAAGLIAACIGIERMAPPQPFQARGGRDDPAGD